jgi:MFS family permease
MALFAYTTSLVPIIIGVALHGFCFGCFIFVSFMVVDEETSKDVRASAQNLFNLVVMGLGITVGSWFAIFVVGEWAKVNGKTDYTKLFSVPMWMSLACLILLLAFYRGGKKTSQVA